MLGVCMHIANTRILKKKKKKKKKGGGGTEEEERKAIKCVFFLFFLFFLFFVFVFVCSFVCLFVCFFCQSPCGNSHPGEVTHLRPEPKETADVRNKHRREASGCVQSFNHLHFQLGKKKKKKKKNQKKNTNTIEF